MSRVLLAMSGGIDSSVSAVLLKRAGHDVTGVFMRHGVQAATSDRPGKQGCCSLEDAYDARRVADQLGIPFYTLNFEKPFEKIVDYFVAEYDRGATPNPCIVCNRDLKFGKLFEYADAIGAEYVATGHYARVERRGGRLALLAGLDARKDQSYVLFPLGQRELSRVMFPVGGFEKPEIRRIAAEAGLRIAGKPESMEICFVPDNDHRRLLRERLGDRLREGEFRTRDGRVLGSHGGHQLFTIGQRKGLGAAFGRPMYVVGIEPETNVVVLSDEDEKGREFFARGVNWVSTEPRVCGARVKIRSMQAGSDARIEPAGPERVRIEFAEPQRAITKGQAAVFYEGEAVLGGGWIE
ncbi:MAG: tRNA 2-thiouridine(34) synthase MnmA [Planctomycetes bacterium]|nr:tRNA 2-thiouridine(34) synthase MnmA [Planctomycetota bacterium]